MWRKRIHADTAQGEDTQREEGEMGRMGWDRVGWVRLGFGRMIFTTELLKGRSNVFPFLVPVSCSSTVTR